MSVFNVLRCISPFIMFFRFAEYRQITVRVYSEMSTEELHEVEALFGLQTLLLKDGKDTLQTKVASLRELLYKLNEVDVCQEPPNHQCSGDGFVQPQLADPLIKV